MNRLSKVLFVAALLLVAAAIAGVAQPHLGRSATSSSTTITVSGNGTMKATPHRASFDFGVQTQASTAAQALSKNASEARKIVHALEKSGIDTSDIQTTEVSLWPQTSNNGNEIVGYTASNSVNVTAALARSGDVVDAAVGAGANNVNGPNLDTSAKTSLYADALKKAVADAKTKAQAIAEAEGLTLGPIVDVKEGGGEPTPIVYGEALAADRAAAPPIEAGTQQIQATVTVTYSTG
jgi:uncharacterized protein